MQREPEPVKALRFHALKCTILSARGGVEMVKCSLVGCEEKVVGGFQEFIDVGYIGNPNATAPGMKTAWCESHKNSLSSHVLGKRGDWLTAKQLE